MTYDEALILIDNIRQSKYKANQWESDFMTSIELRNPNQPITFKQMKCLLRVYERSTGGGKYQRKQYI